MNRHHRIHAGISFARARLLLNDVHKCLLESTSVESWRTHQVMLEEAHMELESVLRAISGSTHCHHVSTNAVD